MGVLLKSEQIHYLIVVGCSCARKTTVVNALRSPEFSEKVFIPKRYVTRPAREKDDTVENAFVTDADFLHMIEDGEIYPHWERQLGIDRIEKYGFAATKKQTDPRLVVLSANNAFVRNLNLSTEEVLKNGKVVLIRADRDVRRQRILGRSPNLPAEEIELRISDTDEDIVERFDPEIVDTTYLNDEESQAAFVASYSPGFA